MGKSPSQFEETIQHQFDRLCKLALKGEKIDYIRHMEYLRKNEVMLSELSQKELDQLAIHDEYGQIHYCVDETLKRRLQTKLLIKTLNFKIGN